MQWNRPSPWAFDDLTIELTESEVIADLDSWFLPPDPRDSGGSAA
jgi:hypothetical protein